MRIKLKVISGNIKTKMFITLIGITLMSITALAAAPADIPTKLPVVDFTATPFSGKAPLNIIFTDISKGSPVMWTWDFGDGTFSNVQNPVHTYHKVGKYSVSLSVLYIKCNEGIVVIKQKTDYITVQKTPFAFFSASLINVKKPLTVRFTDKSTDNPTSWSWNFGDKITSTAKNPTHKYTKAGKYTVTLTVKNEAGGSTVKKTNYITVK